MAAMVGRSIVYPFLSSFSHNSPFSQTIPTDPRPRCGPVHRKARQRNQGHADKRMQLLDDKTDPDWECRERVMKILCYVAKSDKRKGAVVDMRDDWKLDGLVPREPKR